MLNLTKATLDYKQFFILVLLALALLGYSSYLNLSRAQDPGFIIRAAQITTQFPGASPRRVEELVTDKIEQAAQELPELDFITSISKNGLSIVTVNIKESYTEMQPIWDKLRRKIEDVDSDLPSGVNTPEVNDEFGDVFGIIYGITGDGFSFKELEDIAEEVRDELLKLEDASKVEIYGAQEERIFIEYNNSNLTELGLSPSQLGNILESRNILNSGGKVQTNDERFVVEPSGNLNSIKELKNTLIQIPDSNELIALGDITKIYRSYISPPNTLMYTNGEPSLGLAIALRKGGNIVNLGAKVQQLMTDLEASYPIGISFHPINFESDIVQEKVNGFMNNLFQAVTIVSIVMLLFLGIRTGFIVASLIPMTILMTFVFMEWFAIGIDQVSLAALMIALGMLVDNAIVMTESIMIQMQEGKSPAQAALNSAKELKIPLLTSSLTTAAAFLPIFLAESATGEYTASIFKVVTIMLLSSWVLSLSMIPLLCVFLLRIKQEKTSAKSERFYFLYKKGLVAILKRPILTLVIVIGVFAIAIYGFKWVPNIFFPPKEDPQFTVDVELPTATPIEKTHRIVQQLEQYIQQDLLVNDSRPEGIKSWGTYIGEGGPKFVLTYTSEPQTPGYAFLLINTTSAAAVDPTIKHLQDYSFEHFPDATVNVRRLENGAPVKNPIEIRIFGDDVNTLYQLAGQVKQVLYNIHGTQNIDDNWGLPSKKVIVAVNDAHAKRAGVTNSDVATSLETAFSGITLTEYREGNNTIPVVMRSLDASNIAANKSETMSIFSQSNGTAIPLNQVANINLVWEPGVIKRRDLTKSFKIVASLLPGYTAQEINQQAIPELNKISENWPKGYYWEIGGESDESAQANQSIIDKLPITAIIILLLLMGQFNSFRKTIIILLTIPLALIGVVIGLLTTNSYMGFMTFLGIISLIGIVINNAIVLIDRIQLEQNQFNRNINDAIVFSAQRRLRPILLTTITTIAGLIPLWAGGGSMWEPMAIAIIFGLLGATLLTLGVVPVLYTLFFRVSFKNYRVS